MFGPPPEDWNSSCWPVSVSEKPPMANSRFAEFERAIDGGDCHGVQRDCNARQRATCRLRNYRAAVANTNPHNE